MFWKGMPTLSEFDGYEAILKPAFHPQWLPAGVLSALFLGYSMIFFKKRESDLSFSLCVNLNT